jgi:hypothetical protein
MITIIGPAKWAIRAPGRARTAADRTMLSKGRPLVLAANGHAAVKAIAAPAAEAAV